MAIARTIGLGLLVHALLVAAFPAHAADAEVQRQLQQREQQQMELRLKMQQQLDRSTQGPQTPAAALKLRQLDRDQQQRLQQLHEQQLRGSATPAAAAGSDRMQRELERQRALKAGTDHLNRFDAERRLDIDRGSGP